MHKLVWRETLLAPVLLLLAAVLAVSQQQPVRCVGPLSEQQLRNVIGKMPQDRLILFIQTCGVSFPMNGAAEERLKRAGATEPILAAVRAKAPKAAAVDVGANAASKAPAEGNRGTINQAAVRFETVFNTQQPLVWSAVADSKGNVYLGTGHDGKIYKVDPTGKGGLIADLNEIDILALAVDAKDVLYVGTSPNGKVYKIGPTGKWQEFYDPNVKYIWALSFDHQGRLLVATGDRGVVYRVTADGKGETFYGSDATNIVSIVVDYDGSVVLGGHPKGHIYRISPEGKNTWLFDSKMEEIHSLALGFNGGIFAAAVSSGQSSVSSDGSSRSAILEILPDGKVNTLWMGDEMVFSLLRHGAELLFSTGTKGRIYLLERGSTTLLGESSEQQTTQLLEVDPVGLADTIYATSANVGKLFRIFSANR